MSENLGSVERTKKRGLRRTAFCNYHLLRTVKIVSQRVQQRDITKAMDDVLYYHNVMALDICSGIEKLSIKNIGIEGRGIRETSHKTTLLMLDKHSGKRSFPNCLIRQFQVKDEDGWNVMDKVLCNWLVEQDLQWVSLRGHGVQKFLEIFDSHSTITTIIGFKRDGIYYQIAVRGCGETTKTKHHQSRKRVKGSSDQSVELKDLKERKPIRQVREYAVSPDLYKSAENQDAGDTNEGCHPLPTKRIITNNQEEVILEKEEFYEYD